MRQLLLIKSLLILLVMSGYAQAPLGFNYQALARNADGETLADQNIGLQIAIVKGSVDGEDVYSETFTTTTNSVGLFNLQIGTGENPVGDFNAIPWGDGPFFLEISIDITGGENYSLLGAQQLLSVPYALYSNSAGSVTDTCPNGFSEVNTSYCIETQEHTAANWLEASVVCGDLNAELCSWNQWYYAAQNTEVTLENIDNNWEWINDGGDDKSNNAKVVGNGSITADDSFDIIEVSQAFRCCYKR